MQISENPFDHFDRSTGNGSGTNTDDWLDDESDFDVQWGSVAATDFGPDDTDIYDQPLPPRKRHRLKRQYKLHNGKGRKSRKDEIRQSYIINDADTFMSILEMPRSQRRRVVKILKELDISSNNFGSRRYEKVVLALCSLVSDEALSDRPDASVDKRLSNREPFRDLMEATDMTTTELRRTRAAIREETDAFG